MQTTDTVQSYRARSTTCSSLAHRKTAATRPRGYDSVPRRESPCADGSARDAALVAGSCGKLLVGMRQGRSPDRAHHRRVMRDMSRGTTAGVPRLLRRVAGRPPLPVGVLHGPGAGHRPPGSVRHDRPSGGGPAHHALSRHPMPTITSYTTNCDLTPSNQQLWTILRARAACANLYIPPGH